MLKMSITIMSRFPYPENPALTDAPLLDPIKRRWSPLAFSSEPIESEKITTLFEALRWTQSSRNEQPWRIIYATKENPKEFKTLSSLLEEGNEYASEAYLLLLASALPKYEYKDKQNYTHQYDVGAAMHAMFLQAVALDLVAHQMEGFDKEAAHTKLGVPTEVVPMAMMAIGYPGDESKIDQEKLKKRYEQHRQRRPLAETVFKGKWQG